MASAKPKPPTTCSTAAPQALLDVTYIFRANADLQLDSWLVMNMLVSIAVRLDLE